MKIFLLKDSLKENHFITFDFPVIGDLNERDILPFLESIFEEAVVKDNVLKLTNLKPSVFEELKLLLKQNQLPEPYNSIFDYFRKLDKIDLNQVESFPTVISGSLAPLKMDFHNNDTDLNDDLYRSNLSNNEGTPFLVVSMGKWEDKVNQKVTCDIVSQQIVNEYCLLSEQSGEDFVLLVSLPNVKYTTELEIKLKSIFFSYFKEVGIITLFYKDTLYLRDISLKSPFKSSKVTLEQLLIG